MSSISSESEITELVGQYAVVRTGFELCLYVAGRVVTAGHAFATLRLRVLALGFL